MSKFRIAAWVCALLLLVAGPASAIEGRAPAPVGAAGGQSADGPSAMREHLTSQMPAEWQASGTPALAELAGARGTPLTREEFLSLRAEVLAEEADAQAPHSVSPSRAGDLDGDGRLDVLTVETVYEVGSTLTARSGADGRALWSVPDVGLAVPTDIDGDGVSEVLALTDEWTPVASGVRLLTETISLLNGADGTAIWSARLDGSDSRHWSDLGGYGHDLQFVSSLRVMPDATGDGRPEVWVGTLNGVFVDRAEQGDVRITADVFVGRTLESTTGLEVGRVVAAGVDAFPWAIPVDDVSGDGLADAFVLSGHSWDTGLLSAQSVAGTPWWVRPFESGQAVMSATDLDGTGTPDLTLVTFHDGGPSRIAHEGTTGEELWRLPHNGLVEVAGDIDGDGGSDLIQLETNFGGTRVTAWSGGTGEEIWGPVDYLAPDVAWVELCYCFGDVNGDGLWDPLLAEIVFGAGVEVTVRMLDGSDGSQIWSRLLEPGEGLPLPIGADADGDGIEDVGHTAPDGVEVRTGFALTLLWTAVREPGRMISGFYGDDLSGNGVADIVARQLEFVEEDMRGSAAAFGPEGRMWTVP